MSIFYRIGAETVRDPREPQLFLIPSNAPTLDMCVTRKMMIDAAGGNPQAGASAVFDAYGCRVDPSLGVRVPNDCGSSKNGGFPETRWTCPGVRTPMEDPTVANLFKAWNIYSKMMKPLVSTFMPVLGPALMDAVNGMMAGLGFQFDTESSEIAEGAKELASKLKTWAVEAFKDVHPPKITNEAIETFKRLGLSAKGLSDFMPSIVVPSAGTLDPRILLAYTTAREALSFVENLLRGDAASVRMLDKLATACTEVKDIRSAQICRDSKKMLSGVQASVDAFLEQREDITIDKLRRFLDNDTLPIHNMTTNAILAGGGLSRVSIELASSVADKYAGKATNMIRDVNPEKLASLIPNAANRAQFMNRLAKAAEVEYAIGPYVDHAEKRWKDAQSQVEEYRMLNAPAPYASAKALTDFQEGLRVQLQSARRLADNVVAQGSALFQRPREMGYGTLVEQAMRAKGSGGRR